MPAVVLRRRDSDRRTARRGDVRGRDGARRGGPASRWRTRTRRSTLEGGPRRRRAPTKRSCAQLPGERLQRQRAVAGAASWRSTPSGSFGQAQDKDDRRAPAAAAGRGAIPTSKLAKQVPAELRAALAVAAPPSRDATAPAAAQRRAGRRPSSTDARIAAAASPRRLDRHDQGHPPQRAARRRSRHHRARRRSRRFTTNGLPDPSRVFLDLPGDARRPPRFVDRTLRFESDADIVRQVRLGRHPNNTTRVVLDAAGVSSYSVYPLYNPYRLVIDCVRGKPAPLAASRRRPPCRRRAPGRATRRDLAAVTRRPSRRSTVVDRRRRDALPLQTVAAPRDRRVPPSVPLPATTTASVAAGCATAPPPARPAGQESWRAASRSRVSSGSASRGSSSTPATAATIRARRAKASPKPSSCSTSRCGSRSCCRRSPGVEVDPDAAHRRLRPAAGAHRDRQPRRRRPVPVDSRQRQPQRAGARRRDLLPELREQPERRGGRGARERRVGAGDGRAARLRQGDRAEQQARRVARLRHARAARDGRAAAGRRTRRVRDLGVKQAPFVVLIGAAMPSVLAEISFVTNAQEAQAAEGRTSTGSGSPKRCSTRSGSTRRRSRARRASRQQQSRLSASPRTA